VGESGSGKSTLLKLIYGLLAPDAGSISFRGQYFLGPQDKLIPGHERMKMVTQDFSLNTYAKVYDNIASMLPNTDLKAKKQETLEMMEFLRIDHLADKRVVDLSGGEQQRVAIARAIITEPEVLLMDEPFSQVDTLLKNDLRADIKRLAKYLGITVILVSHDPADGLSLADQMVILRGGSLLETGKAELIYNNPRHIYTAQLLANCNVLTTGEAQKIGIKTRLNNVVIYPEWIQIKKGWSSKGFIVKDCFFKGFYNELLLEKEGVRLRALNTGIETFEKGQNAPVIIEKFLEF
jgi:ABC-type sugar transport system ATPase subunit